MNTYGEALEDLEQRLFVGREGELAFFHDWLTVERLVPEILNVHGAGGVGKSTLMRAFRRAAASLGLPAVFVDARTIPASSEGLLRALGGAKLEQVVRGLGGRPGAVVLLDSFEEIGSLAGFLRVEVLPALPVSVRVAIAGRYSLDVAWPADDPLTKVVRSMPLADFSAEQSRAFLHRRGLGPVNLEQVLAAAGNNPLALSLAADLVLQHGVTNLERAPEWRLAVRTLVDQFLRDIKSPQLRHLLEACAVVRQFDEALLSAIAARPDLGPAFHDLCRLSSVQPSEHGVAIHDDVRRALAQDLRWRSPDRYRELRLRALAHYADRMTAAPAQEREWLTTERMFLWENGFIQAMLFPETEPGEIWVEPGRPADYEAVREIWLWALENVLPRLIDIESGMDVDAAFPHPDLFLDSPVRRLGVARASNGQVLGFNIAMPVCHDTLPILAQHGLMGPLVRALWPDELLGTLPATPDVTNVFFLLHMIEGSVQPEAVRAALLRDQFGLFARGGVYLVATPAPIYKTLLESLGFQPVSEARRWPLGPRYPMDGYVLDLSGCGVEPWIEAIIAGRSPAEAVAVATGVRDLTTREREVAGLVLQGLSNKEIADSLFIGERTVETHVEHILRKLDLPSRSQVASRLGFQKRP